MQNANIVVENALKSVAEKYNYENCKISAKQINSGGANYSSYIFLATISSPGKNDLRLFAKVAGMGDKVRKFAEHIYSNEVFFYTDFMKEYRQLEEKHNIPTAQRLQIPEYYGCNTERYHEILVLEDLTANGFQSFDRFKSVTWEETAKSIQQLVQFHALSFALAKKKPEEFVKAKKQFVFNNTDQYYVEFINNVGRKVIEATEENDKQRIENFIKTTLNDEKFRYFFEPIRKEVLIHGDYRPNNLMYKLKDGSCQVVLLDLQTIHCGSPAFDLMYLINFGFDGDFRKANYQKTLDYYYNELCAALQRFELDPNETYSREDFEYEIQEILPFTVLFGLCGLLVITIDEDTAPQELGDLGPEDFAFAPNERYRQTLKEFIDFYTKIGVIP